MSGRMSSTSSREGSNRLPVGVADGDVQPELPAGPVLDGGELPALLVQRDGAQEQVELRLREAADVEAEGRRRAGLGDRLDPQTGRRRPVEVDVRADRRLHARDPTGFQGSSSPSASGCRRCSHGWEAEKRIGPSAEEPPPADRTAPTR
jgi:hypothetical protein